MVRVSTRSVLAILLSLALLPALVLADPPVRATVHPQVWQALQAEGQTEVLVVLRAQADLWAAEGLATRADRGRYVYEALWAMAETSQRDLRASLAARGIEHRAFYLVNALQLRADGGLVRDLAARADVARIVPNPWLPGIDEPAPRPAAARPEVVEPNLSRVGADDVWARGYTGQGTVVAGNDTGIDWDHPALVDQYRSQQPGYGRHDYNWHDAIHSGGGICGADSPEPCDDYGHGTHTLGTIVGDDGLGHQIGMAPGAKWIGCRNMNQGYGTPATYLECFEFFLAPYPLAGTPADGDPALAPDVINNSWTCPPSEGCDASTLETAVEALRQAGIVVVAAAGNSGSAGCGSVSRPPAIYQQSLTVGAFDHDTDQIAGFSGRGPVTYGGETYVKPDIAAPGVGVLSSTPGGAYGSSSGTSMATPHVAGAVALLLSAAPGYEGQVDLIEGALTVTAEPKSSAQCGDPAPPNSVWGWGILDVPAAVEWATSGLLQGTVTEAAGGGSLAGVQVLAEPQGGGEGASTLTDPQGAYSLTLTVGVYDVTAAASGLLSSTVAGVEVTATTELDFALMVAQAPQARFESNSPIRLGEALVLTNTSTAASSWAWTFGDGQGSDQWAPSHVYSTTGTYTVSLVVSNSLGVDVSRSAVHVERVFRYQFYLPLIVYGGEEMP